MHPRMFCGKIENVQQNIHKKSILLKNVTKSIFVEYWKMLS